MYDGSSISSEYILFSAKVVYFFYAGALFQKIYLNL